jgi:hypothetical protein
MVNLRYIAFGFLSGLTARPTIQKALRLVVQSLSAPSLISLQIFVPVFIDELVRPELSGIEASCGRVSDLARSAPGIFNLLLES